MKHLLPFFLLGIAACSRPSPDATNPSDLSAWFDCLRENGGVTIAAHRGGPSPGFPENALETMQHNLERGLMTFEVDVAQSPDGVMYLMHDQTLGRTTSGSGSVARTPWTQIRDFYLVDNDGRATDFHPPRLTAVLDWAVEAGALLELDRKFSASFEGIVQAVQDADAQDNVILITYSDEEAAEVAALGPDLMMTAGARSASDLNRLAASGVNLQNLVVWSGTSEPDPDLWEMLADRGIEPAFGTLGRPGERLDDRYAADGDLGEYDALVRAGLVLLATDAPHAAADALEADDLGIAACGR
jgi:glycerophosphoryl diester phosphodiesterase